MVFSSPVFLFYFLPAFLALYFLIPQKNLVLLVFSLFFYAWGEGIFILLMITSGLSNYAFARWIAQSTRERARWVLALGVGPTCPGYYISSMSALLSPP